MKKITVEEILRQAEIAQEEGYPYLHIQKECGEFKVFPSGWSLDSYSDHNTMVYGFNSDAINTWEPERGEFRYNGELHGLHDLVKILNKEWENDWN